MIVKNNEETYFDPDLYSRIKGNHIRNVKALETVVQAKLRMDQQS